MLDNLRIFIVAAKQRSLSAAASELGMTIATVSRRVLDLERSLQCELFHRSNKGLTLTPAGQSYFDETSDFVHELDLRLANLDESLNSLEGELRVMAPTNIGHGPLDEFWQTFVINNPGISLNILLSDPDDDVISNQVDIAIRSGPQQNSSLIHQRLGAITPVLVASARLSEPLPDDISTLEGVPSIAAQMFGEWKLTDGKNVHLMKKKHRHISNDMAIIRNLVKGGAGIALLPKSMVYREIERGELIQVLPEWSGIPREISLLWPKKRVLSARTLQFRKALTAFLKNQDWFVMNS